MMIKSFFVDKLTSPIYDESELKTVTYKQIITEE